MKGDNSSILIEPPGRKELENYAKQVGTATQPDWIADLGLRPDPHAAGKGTGITSIRHAEYAGHKIVIKITYEIEVDAIPFRGHATVDDRGRLHCHAIPYASYASAVDLVKHLIDLYPESFGGKRAESGYEHGPASSLREEQK